MMTNAGARYTNELPWTSGSRVPKYECSIVVVPESSSIVEITVAVSFWNQLCKRYRLKFESTSNSLPTLYQISKFREEMLTSVPPMTGTMIKGMNMSEPANDK